MRVLCLTMFLSVSLFSSFAGAGKYNEVLSIGDKAPAWDGLVDAVSGKKHSLAELKEFPVVVVLFTCNSCPVAAEYEDRILTFAKEYGVGTGGQDPRAVKLPAGHGKVALVAINVNRVKEDLPPAMKARAEKRRYPFPYLFDETQKIARDYGALFTPEIFVLDQDRRVVYMGAVDDNAEAEKVQSKYLAPAVEAALAGKKPETAETRASGCRIRFARQRR